MFLVVAAILIAVASLLVSHFLVKDLSEEERHKMEVWAQALRALNQADENTDVTLILHVMQGNNTIPVIVMDSDGTVTDYRNIEMSEDTREDSAVFLSEYGQRLLREGKYIRLFLGDSTLTSDYQVVCYDDSTLLKRLASYPYWQMGLVVVFVAVAVVALLSIQRAEQNRVWVGLSKETAHQLGTPISSLMAWMEMLRENHPGDALIPEMDRDVKRLERIADRFSKIGSLPEPKEESMNKVLEHVVDYMNKRTSSKVEMVCDLPEHEVIVRMNASLFEWVIENLCKNAVDAMEGAGRIVLSLRDSGKRVAIEVSDNGRGIRKKDVKNVFTPGFTTKHRGWGLGLSLARRIVEEYHHGRIFVKSSELGKGTTFRIEIYK